MKKLNENKKKINALKKKLNIFSSKLIDKFSDYIVTVGLLPAAKITYLDREAKKINLVVIVNDSDRKKLSRDELKDKVSNIVNKLASEVDNTLEPETILLSELWYNCLYRNYKVIEVLQTVAPVYDKGLLSSLKNTQLHNKMINEKFDKFVSSYLLLGDVLKGNLKDENVNVGIVIDDSGVKDMDSSELKNKLELIAQSKSIESGDFTGNKSKINSKIFLLTELWDKLKEGDTEIIEIVRKGIPIKDNGTFLCWKNLVDNGKFQPDLDSLKNILHEKHGKIYQLKNEIYQDLVNKLYSILVDTSQSVLMHHDIFCEEEETISNLHEILVKKEKILEKSYLKILMKLNDHKVNIKKGKFKINSKIAEELIEESQNFMEKLKRIY
jgi:hypothetical protein